MASSRPARSAGTWRRRLAARLLVTAALAAFGWLAGALLATTASAAPGTIAGPQASNNSAVNAKDLTGPPRTEKKKAGQKTGQNAEQKVAQPAGGQRQQASRRSTEPVGQVVNSLAASPSTKAAGSRRGTVFSGAPLNTINGVTGSVSGGGVSTPDVPPGLVNSETGDLPGKGNKGAEKGTNGKSSKLPPPAGKVEKVKKVLPGAGASAPLFGLLEPATDAGKSGTGISVLALTPVLSEQGLAPAANSAAGDRPGKTAKPSARETLRKKAVLEAAGPPDRAIPGKQSPRPLPHHPVPCPPAGHVSTAAPANDNSGHGRGLAVTLTSFAGLSPPAALGVETWRAAKATGRTPGLPVTSPD